MTQAKYREYEKHMLSCVADSAHDAGHVYRVLHAALVFAGEEKSADLDVLICAALLHDIGREAQFSTGEDHALAGARMAKEFLLGKGEEPAFADRVAECIRTHRFRSDAPPASVEARLIYEADKLDVCGVLGIARTLMYQGRMGEPVYSVGPGGEVLSGEEDKPSLFQEYHMKLRRLTAGFRNPAARRLALNREKAAHSFMESLRAETAAAEAGSAWRLLGPDASDRQRRVLNLALLTAGGASERVSVQELAAGAMGREDDCGAPALRMLRDAARLDDLGAMGVCLRLMQLGRERRSMSDFLETEWDDASFKAKHAGNMAKARRETVRLFTEELRSELDANREEAERILLRCLG